MADEIRWLDISQIDLPTRGRQHNPDRIAELAGDMAKNGQLQDIIVMPKGDGRFDVVAGRGRYLAAKRLKWDKIQCLVKENLSELDRVLLMISENDEREDTSPIDRGLSYIWAMEAGDLTQGALATKLGKTQGYISQYVAAAQLPEPVRKIINRLIIGITHINLIARLPTPEAQIAIAEKCQKEDLSVKQLENIVNNALSVSAKSATGSPTGGAASAQSHPKALADGFKIGEAGGKVRIAGIFPMNTPDPELVKAFEASLQDWHEKGKQPKQKPNSPKGSTPLKPDQRQGPGQGPNIDDLRKMKDAMLKGGPGAFAGFMVGPMEASLAMMNQRLSDPNVSEEEKAKLKEGIQKLQEQIAKLKQK